MVTLDLSRDKAFGDIGIWEGGISRLSAFSKGCISTESVAQEVGVAGLDDWFSKVS